MRFRIKGTTVKISFLFLAVVLIIITNDSHALWLIFLLSALLHEAGHLLSLYMTRTHVCAVHFNLFGMKIIKCACPGMGYLDDCRIALMGPIMNLIVFLIFLTLFFCFNAAILLEIAFVNGILAFFNLLPVFSLDGGSALYALIALKRSHYFAQRSVTIISFVVVVPLTLFGFWLLMKTKYNFTILAAGLYLFVLLIFKK